jgi:Ca2+-binding EF-hand superfamily protein
MGFQGQQAGYGNFQQLPPGFKFTPTPGITKQQIKDNCYKLFGKYDSDKSLSLNLNEAAMAIREIYADHGQIPSDNDILYVFQYFDKDGSGILDRKEFHNMALYLAGVQ